MNLRAMLRLLTFAARGKGDSHRVTLRLVAGTRRHSYLQLVLACCIATVVGQASAQMLWYGGDADASRGLFNNTHTLDRSAHDSVLDDFVVPNAVRWHVTSVFSNNVSGNPFSVAPFAQAEWSIRAGAGPGNSGQVLYSGINSVSVTPTGRSLGGAEYMVVVSGLSIDLGPGVYFLSVSPITSTIPNYYVGLSDGANSVGFTGPSSAFQEGDPDHLVPLLNGTASMGVIGTALPLQTNATGVPALSTLGYALLTVAVALLGIAAPKKLQ